MRTARCLTAITALCLGTSLASAQVFPPIFHDPFLNWDFVNFTGQTVNDFELVVENPNWTPPQIYAGGLGFPNFTVTSGDFVPANPGNETRVRWFGRDFAPGAIAHVGAAMMNSGRILDAYWTLDGVKVGPSIGITYEKTRVTPDPTGGPNNNITMILQTSPAFVAENPGSQLVLQNIRTFMDLPADLLGLDDITRELDLATLQSFETTPSVQVPAPLTADSFFDVFVGLSPNTNPGFESLLVADVTVVTPTATTVIGRFWNINPQSPEPQTAVVALAGLGLLRRYRNR